MDRGIEIIMKILCIGQIENKRVYEEVQNQTVKPDRIMFYVDDKPAKGIDKRRKRIAENHKKLQSMVRAYKPDLVWQVEGDSVLPKDTLERLIKRYEELKDISFGYVSGVQIGRHGVYAIGAWRMTPDGFASIDYKLKGVQAVDATGFYCLLAPADVWLKAKCEWNGERYGPDVNWGLDISKNKYVDMGIKIGHRLPDGAVLDFNTPSLCNVVFTNDNGKWNYKTRE